MRNQFHLLRRIVVSVALFVVVVIGFYFWGKNREPEEQHNFGRTSIHIGEDLISLPLPAQAKIVGLGMYTAGGGLLVDYHVSGKGRQRRRVVLSESQNKHLKPGMHITCEDAKGHHTLVVQQLVQEVKLHKENANALLQQKKLLEAITKQRRQHLLLLEKEKHVMDHLYHLRELSREPDNSLPVRHCPNQNVGPTPLLFDESKKGTGTSCRKGPKGASHKMYLSPFSTSKKKKWIVQYTCPLSPPPSWRYSAAQKTLLDRHAQFLTEMGIPFIPHYNNRVRVPYYQLTWQMFDERRTAPLTKKEAIQLAAKLRWFRVQAEAYPMSE